MMNFTTEERRNHVSKWRASGLNQAAYCRQEGLLYHRFRSWLQCPPITIDDIITSRPEFVEIPKSEALIAACARRESAAITLTLPGGVAVHLQDDCDPQWAARFVAGFRSC
jgi:hypothetical protein